jgi:CubicO group peptidase (beta-lactamase class C family)
MSDSRGMPDSPFSEWPTIAPQDAGLAPEIADRLDHAFSAGSLPNLHSLVVARHGHLVLERYYAGRDERLGEPLGTVQFNSTTLHDVRSVTKSIVGLFYGIALSEGLVPPPDARLVDQFPAYFELARDPARRRLKVEHALTMQLGIEWDERLPYTDPRNGEIAMEHAPDRYRFILERPIVEEPGVRGNYCGGATAILGHLISREAGMGLLRYAQDKLFAPLGIDAVEWTSSSNGEASAAAGLSLRPRDLTRIGQLVLNHGRWNGQQVVPGDWLVESLVSLATRPDGGGYGYQWWLGRGPTGDYARVGGLGNRGQQLLVVLNLGLIITVNAGNYDDWSAPNVPALVNHLVMAGLQPT